MSNMISTIRHLIQTDGIAHVTIEMYNQLQAEWIKRCGMEEVYDELTDLRSQVAELQRQLDEAAGQEPYLWEWSSFPARPNGNGICMVKDDADAMAADGYRITPLYAKPINLPALIEQAKAEEREESLKVMRKAVVALAHAAESNPVYQDAYNELDAAIRARKP